MRNNEPVYIIGKVPELSDKDRILKLYDHIKEIKEELKDLRAKLRKKDRELRHYWKLAESWMHDYDILKAKYEPTEIVTSKYNPETSKHK